MAVKRAQAISFFLCDHCAAVHIGLFRNGKMFAEAIPNEPDSVLEEMQRAIAESRERQSSPSKGCH